MQRRSHGRIFSRRAWFRRNALILTALALYSKYVAPFGTGTISSVPNEAEYVNQSTVRFDQKLSETQQLTAYYYFNTDNDTVPFSNFPGGGSERAGVSRADDDARAADQCGAYVDDWDHDGKRIPI